MILNKILFSLIIFYGGFCLFSLDATEKYTATPIILSDSNLIDWEIRSSDYNAFLNNNGCTLIEAEKMSGNKFYTNYYIWDYLNGLINLNKGIEKLGSTRIMALNDAGKVVGVANQRSQKQCPFIWDSKNLYLIDFSDMGVIAEAKINNNDQILWMVEADQRKFRWDYYIWDQNHGNNRIEFPDDIKDHFIVPTAFNDHGYVLFQDFAAMSFFIWQNDNVLKIDFSNSLALKGVAELMGVAMNNQGDVVGFVSFESIDEQDEEEEGENPLLSIGMIWTKEGEAIPIEIKNAEVEIVGINDQRIAVGSARHLDEEGECVAREAISWSPQEGIINLNDCISPDLNIVLENGLTINQQGQILTKGYTKEGQQVWFLLTPIKN